MKFLIILCTLVSSIAAANTVRIGNGGDTVDVESPAPISIVQTAPIKLRYLVRAWLARPEANLILPASKFLEFESIIAKTVLVAQQAPCLVNNENRTAAAYTAPNVEICISIQLLNKNTTPGLAEIQILSLLAHEYLHLLNYGEKDARTFQNQVTQYILKYGIPSLAPSTFDSTQTNFVERFKKIDWNNKKAIAVFNAELVRYLKTEIEPLILHQESNYPFLMPQENILGDVMARVLYLGFATIANWENAPDSPSVKNTMTKLFTYNGQRVSTISTSKVVQMFYDQIGTDPLYPSGQIPYLDASAPTGADLEKYLHELEAMITQLNQSRFNMLLWNTPVRLTF